MELVARPVAYQHNLPLSVVAMISAQHPKDTGTQEKASGEDVSFDALLGTYWDLCFRCNSPEPTLLPAWPERGSVGAVLSEDRLSTCERLGEGWGGECGCGFGSVHPGETPSGLRGDRLQPPQDTQGHRRRSHPSTALRHNYLSGKIICW